MFGNRLVRVGYRLILASASPSRLRLLQGAGLRPEVIASHVPEDGVEDLPPAEAVLVLARRKAVAVSLEVEGPALVVGCDSMLELGGESYGKPSSPDEARERWRRMRNRAGVLHTGHCVIDTADGSQAARTDSARVRFGNPTDAEIDAYIATGEPLRVAGAFTLEGLSSPWIDSIDGNYGTITGISIPLLRQLLAELGVGIVDLWS
jgi:septum formation protein